MRIVDFPGSDIFETLLFFFKPSITCSFTGIFKTYFLKQNFKARLRHFNYKITFNISVSKFSKIELILQVKLAIGVDSTKPTVDFEVDTRITDVTILLTGKTVNLDRIEKDGKHLLITKYIDHVVERYRQLKRK